MPASNTWRSFARVVVPVICCLAVVVSCAKDPLRVDRNRPPSTFLVSAPAESSAASYRIHLYWRGEDTDGYVSGFLWAWDDSTIGAFRYTTRTDSTFELEVNDSTTLLSGTGQQQPGVAKNHTFFIRAVDNLGKADPRLTTFNRRIYNATTDKPSVRFVGAIPSGIGIDTLCDGQPFKICWTGNDPDGYVAYYRWDIGPYSSPLITDTCAVFNDPNTPGSPPISSGVYTFTVTAVDNAFSASDAGSGGRILLVENHDPETWFLDSSGGKGQPVGYYYKIYDGGQPVNPTVPVTFAQGDTVPYRATVWWKWDGSDAVCNEGDKLSGWSLILRTGTRNNLEPYVIGFLDTLCVDPTDGPVRFRTNDPRSVLDKCQLQSLVLDSLDGGRNMLVTVASRDASGRSDGTPASFAFNCNFPPNITGLAVADTIPPTGPNANQKCKRIYWTAWDPEDGYPKESQITLDGFQRIRQTGFEQEYIIPESRFFPLSPLNPHTVEVRVGDRAGFLSDEILSVQLSVTYPP